MKNALWITAIVLAFVAGYFTRGASQSTSPASPQAEITQPINKAADAQVSSEQLSAAAKAVFAAKEKATPKAQQIQNTPEPQTGAAVAPKTAADPAQVVDSNNPTVKKYPNEISDEDIDKFIPAPFNQKLKNHHGELREKYKDFAATNQQLEWDKNMQNKLSDSISSNPYAKFLTIESLQCKVNLCEIRLYETKEGAWSLIMAEMRLQDWWDFGGTSASGFGTDTPSKMGWYVLLPRR
jgi:hypothetical protein